MIASARLVDGTQGAHRAAQRGVMEEAKKEFVEPELVKYEDKLADITAGNGLVYGDAGVDE